MEDKHRLDDIIGKKLNQFEAPYQPSSWDALNERLDAETELPNESFDELIQKKISDIETPYQPLHWLKMSALLDEKAALKRELVRCKTAEVLLVLLLLFTFTQIPPVTSSLPNLKLIASKNKVNVPASDTELDLSKVNTLNNQYIDRLKQLNQQPISRQTSPLSDRKKISTPLTKLAEQPIALLITEHRAINSIAQGGETKEEPSDSPIDILDKSQYLLDANQVASIGVPFVKIKQHKHLRIGMFTALNLDHIKTPYDEVFNQAPYTRLVLEYGGGFSIGWQWKRMEIETGLSYNHKAYKPILNPVYYGNINSDYKVEGIKDIELNTFQIPLHLRYDWLRKGAWQVYGLGGAAIHVATQANYDVASVRASALNVNANPSASGQQIILSPTQLNRFEQEAKPSPPQSTKLNQKQFPDGWMNGGTFNENNYYTLNIGLGAEHYLDSRWSLFLQPTYKKHLGLFDKGIGPNLDRISTLEILIGAKVGL